MEYVLGGLGLIIIFAMVFIASRYRRCPSDRILVIYGSVGGGRSARCIHGGGALIWPVVQSYAYLNLTPMTISIPLKNALSLQNIRINVPSTFTVGISTQPEIMTNAAERLLCLKAQTIEQMAGEIIFGQLRLTVASLTIEQINQDRESFLESIRKNVEPELNKIGLYLINVNITDITDESDYIESIGKKAASEAINKARIDVAEQEKNGAIGQAMANREKEIRVAENVAESDKGQKKAEAERRIFIQAQEAEAVIGEANANREKEIRVAENIAAADKGKKKAEADRRIFIQSQEAEAVQGENKSKADIAKAEAELAVIRAEADRAGEVAKREAEAAVQKAQYALEQERLNAAEVVRQEIELKKTQIAADAVAERHRREAAGQADAVRLKYEAEAEGIRKLIEGKAQGYQSLIASCNGDAQAASTFLMIEKIESMVEKQVEAIKNIRIDKVTVWDSGAHSEGDGGATANFLSGMIKSVPPLHDVAAMAGVRLPEYLGRLSDQQSAEETAKEEIRSEKGKKAGE